MGADAGGCGDGSLHALWDALGETRRALQDARTGPSGHRRTQEAVKRHLDALEAYVAALRSAGRPLPYQIRDELAMYRSLGRTDQRRKW